MAEYRNLGNSPRYPARLFRPRAGSTDEAHDDRSGLPIPYGYEAYDDDLLVDVRGGIDEPGYDGVLPDPVILTAPPVPKYWED